MKHSQYFWFELQIYWFPFNSSFTALLRHSLVLCCPLEATFCNYRQVTTQNWCTVFDLWFKLLQDVKLYRNMSDNSDRQRGFLKSDIWYDIKSCNSNHQDALVALSVRFKRGVSVLLDARQRKDKWQHIKSILQIFFK